MRGCVPAYGAFAIGWSPSILGLAVDAVSPEIERIGSLCALIDAHQAPIARCSNRTGDRSVAEPSAALRATVDPASHSALARR